MFKRQFYRQSQSFTRPRLSLLNTYRNPQIATMSTQSVVGLSASAGEPLYKHTVPIPTPAEGEVLLKLTAVGLNPMDCGLRERPMFRPMFNLETGSPIGFDLVGTVVSTGAGVDFPKGTRLYTQAIGGHTGGTQEYSAVTAKWAVKVPDNISDADASTLPCNTATTGLSLFIPSLLGIHLPGEGDNSKTTLVIVGAGTQNGRIAIQFAKLAGVGEIIGIASLSSAEELKKLGATHIVDRKSTDVNAAVREITGDEVLHVYDCFNADISLAVSLLSNMKKGKVVHLNPRATFEKKTEEDEKKKGGFETTSVYGSPASYPEFSEVWWRKTFPEWITSGKYVVGDYEVIKGLDAEKIDSALDALRDGTARTKFAIVL